MLANLYALVETAKTNGIEPWSYFKKIFTALPLVTTVEPVEALLPWKVSKVNYPVFKGALTVILWIGCRVVPISRWLDEGARQSNDSH